VIILVPANDRHAQGCRRAGRGQELVKDSICEYVGFVDDCSLNIRLEMILVDPRNWTEPNRVADCTDQSEDVQPVRSFVNGQDNELMILRACAKVAPVFPTSGFGKNIQKDGNGDYSLIATSVFVQEPR
ncbi:MAG: hypothetical protein AAFR45_02925, partial [Pseudomonadota bacterium]